MVPKTPQAISHSHKNLFTELTTIINTYPDIKEPSQNLKDAISKHFQKEETYALSPLGLLLDLADGNWQLDEKTATKMSEAVNAKLTELKDDHKNIYKNLKTLKDIAEEDDNHDLKKFINNLETHMELEDQVLYPATVLIVNSILIGDYFKKNKDID